MKLVPPLTLAVSDTSDKSLELTEVQKLWSLRQFSILKLSIIALHNEDLLLYIFHETDIQKKKKKN